MAARAAVKLKMLNAGQSQDRPTPEEARAWTQVKAKNAENAGKERVRAARKVVLDATATKRQQDKTSSKLRIDRASGVKPNNHSVNDKVRKALRGLRELGVPTASLETLATWCSDLLHDCKMDECLAIIVNHNNAKVSARAQARVFSLLGATVYIPILGLTPVVVVHSTSISSFMTLGPDQVYVGLDHQSHGDKHKSPRAPRPEDVLDSQAQKHFNKGGGLDVYEVWYDAEGDMTSVKHTAEQVQSSVDEKRASSTRRADHDVSTERLVVGCLDASQPMWIPMLGLTSPWETDVQPSSKVDLYVSTETMTADRVMFFAREESSTKFEACKSSEELSPVLRRWLGACAIASVNSELEIDEANIAIDDLGIASHFFDCSPDSSTSKIGQERRDRKDMSNGMYFVVDGRGWDTMEGASSRIFGYSEDEAASDPQFVLDEEDSDDGDISLDELAESESSNSSVDGDVN